MVGVPPQSPCQPPPQHHGSRGQARRCWALPGPGSHAVPRRAALSPAKPCCLPPAWHRTTSPGHPDTPRPAPCILLPCRGACNGADPPPSSPRCSPHFGGKPRLEDQGRILPPFPGLRGEARCSPVPPVQPPPPLPRAAREPCPHGGQHPGTPRHCTQHPAQPASGVGAALRDVCLHAPSPRANLG